MGPISEQAGFESGQTLKVVTQTRLLELKRLKKHVVNQSIGIEIDGVTRSQDFLSAVEDAN